MELFRELQLPNVDTLVHVYYTNNDVCFATEEYFTILKELINSRPNIKESKVYIMLLFETVLRLHRLGISHRYLKPDNIKIPAGA